MRVMDEEGDVIEVDADLVVGIDLGEFPSPLGGGGGMGVVDEEDGEGCLLGGEACDASVLRRCLQVIVVTAFVNEFVEPVAAGDVVTPAGLNVEGGEEDFAVHLEDKGRVDAVLGLGM